MNFTDLRVIKTREQLQNALLSLLEEKELKKITVKEICDKAGISRNAFYQHYGYKEDLYDQMAAQATERIRESLTPIIPDISHLEDETIPLYAKGIMAAIVEVRELLTVMLRRDDGMFMHQLTDLIFDQFLTNALPFFHTDDSEELRLYYEFLSAGIAAFIIKWLLDDTVTKDKAQTLLSDILRQTSTRIPQ